MKRIIFILISILLTFSSCEIEKRCSCEMVMYESSNEPNFEWIEVYRFYTDNCPGDTLFGIGENNNGNITYSRSVIECD